MRKNLLKTLIIGLMAILFIIPSLAGAGELSNKRRVPALETAKMTMGSEVINQEVIQILRKGEMTNVILNIVGQPSVYFKVQYSQTAMENSYALLPKGAGVIGANGLGTVSFDLRKLGKEEVYLKVTTSDTKDFAKPRVISKPLVFNVEQPVKVKNRSAMDDLERIADHGGCTGGICFAPPTH